MKTVKEALEDGTLGLEDEIDYADMTEEEFKQEIERLEKRIEDLNTINEEHKILNGMIRKELQQKENIIKEVREYTESNLIHHCNDFFLNDIKTILDKENKE